MDQFEEAKTIVEQLDEKEVKFLFKPAELYYHLGLTARMMHDLLQAVDFFKTAIKLSSPKDDIIILAHYQIGHCYFKLEKWLQALDFYNGYLNSLLTFKRPDLVNLENLTSCYSNIGACAHKLKQYALADFFLKESIELSQGRFLKIDTKTKSLIATIFEEQYSSDTDADSKYGGSVCSLISDQKDALSSDEESWGDIDLGPVETKTTLFLPENIEEEPANEIAKYKLLPESEFNYVTIKYPKPSVLYSMKTKDGHGLMSETDLDHWLHTLMEKTAKEVLDAQEKLSTELLIAKYSQCLKDNRSFSREWCLYYVTLCFRLLIIEEYDTCWKFILAYISELQIYLKSHKNLKGSRLDLTLQLIGFASKLWSPNRDSSLNQILSVVSQLGPTYDLLTEIIKVETYGHHLQSRKQIIATLADAYSKGRKMFNFASKEDRPDCLALQVRALVDLHLYMSDRSMITASLQGDVDESLDDEDLENPLCEDSHRMGILEKLYLELEPSFLKAKAAFAMGLYQYQIVEDYDTAEKLFFECLYILDNIDSAIKNTKPLLSSLGSQALRLFADVLFINYKYRYAIATYDAALISLSVRNKTSEYYSLMRDVAQISTDQDDIARAIALYSDIVTHYKENNRINEAVYVYEILCGMHVEMGYFNLALSCLQEAAVLLPDYQRFIDDTTPTTTTFDPEFIKIQLEMARVHLYSYHWDKGIDLLEQLSRYNHPAATTIAIHKLLACAFIKKRCYKEAESYIEQWKYLQEEQLKVGATLSKKGMKSTDSYETHYYQLKAKNSYYASKYMKALYYIDKAIMSANPKRYHVLGKFYSLRGQILSSLSLISSSVQFHSETHHSQSSREKPDLNFKQPGDVLQECISTHRQAYYYFRLTGDDTRLAVSVSNIAETYLEYLFWKIATNETSFEDISTMSHFEISIIGQNLREKLSTTYTSGSQTHSVESSEDSTRGNKLNSSEGHHEKEKSSIRLGHKRSKSAISTIKDVLPFKEKTIMGPPPPRDPKDKKKARNSAKQGGKRPNIKKESSSSSLSSKDYVINLDVIESAAEVALDIGASSSDVLLALNSYMNMAELRYLQGKKDIAISFWKECKENLSLYFLDSSKVILNEAPLSFLQNLYHISKRLVRFLFLMPRNFINNHLSIIDTYLLLENDIEQQLKKAVGSQLISSMNTIESSLPRTLFSLKRQKKKKSTTNVKESKGEGFTLTALSTSPASNEPSFISQMTASMKNSQPIGSDNEKTKAARENASFIWGQQFYLKRQRMKYNDGKISSEELKKRSHVSLRKLIRLMNIARSQETEYITEMNRRFSTLSKKSTRFLVPMGTIKKNERERSDSAAIKPVEKPPLVFDEIVQTQNDKAARLLYILKIDDQLIYYTPTSGSQRIQKIGGKEDIQEKYPPVPTAILEIHLLDSEEQYLTLSVPASMTIVQILEYLCDQSTWGENITKSGTKKKTFLSSLLSSKTEIKIEKLEITKDFYDEFENLLGLIGDERGTEKSPRRIDPLSFISFATRKTTRIGSLSNSAIVPLKSKMQKGVFECFSKKELESSEFRPIKLFLYVSANLSKSKSYNATIANTIHFTEEIGSFLSSLIRYEKDKEMLNTRPIDQVLYELQQMFAPLLEIAPSSKSESDMESSTRDSPLIIISSKYMNAFPWELIIPDEYIIRFFTLDDVVGSRISSIPGLKKIRKANSLGLMACYYSQGTRHVHQQESVRKTWVTQNVYNHLNLSDKHNVEYVGDNMPLFPFHSPLVRNSKRIAHYKAKYKNIIFVDLWEHFLKPEDIIKLSLQNSNPVFILSYADLLEISTCLYYLMRERPAPTFLFVPEHKMKSVGTKLNKLQGTIRHEKVKSPYHFLMAATKAIMTELQVPIVVVNPPTCN